MNQIKSKNSAAKPFTISKTTAWMILSIPFGIVAARVTGDRDLLTGCLLFPIEIYLISWIWTYMMKSLPEVELIQWIKKKLDIPKESNIFMFLTIGIVYFCMGAIKSVCGLRLAIVSLMRESHSYHYVHINAAETVVLGLAGGLLTSILYMILTVLAWGILHIPKIIIEWTVCTVWQTYEYFFSSK